MARVWFRTWFRTWGASQSSGWSHRHDWLTPLSYIIAVNASIVADSGGTCVCNDPIIPGVPPCVDNTEYALCKAEIKKDLVTATAAISALGTFFMGLLANLCVDPRPSPSDMARK